MLLVKLHHFSLELGPLGVGGFELLVLVLQRFHLRLNLLHLLH